MFSVILPAVVTTERWRGQQKTALEEETVDCFTFETPLWYEGGKLKRIFLLFVLKEGHLAITTSSLFRDKAKMLLS